MIFCCLSLEERKEKIEHKTAGKLAVEHFEYFGGRPSSSLESVSILLPNILSDIEREGE
jgi:hypothetical protein